MASNGIRIIDADGHVLEHPTAMLAVRAGEVPRPDLPPRDQAGRQRGRALRRPHDERQLPRRRRHRRHVAARSACARRPASSSTREIKPGAFDPKARLAEVAIDDIQQSVVYPTLMLGLPGFADRRVRRGAGARLQPLGRRLLPLRPDASVRRRASFRSRTSTRAVAVDQGGEGARPGRRLHAARTRPSTASTSATRPTIRIWATLPGPRPDGRLPSLSRARHARRLPRPAPLELSRAGRLGRLRRGDEPEPDDQPAQHLLLAGACRTSST